MDNMTLVTLIGGPHDGEKVEIHREQLKIKPILSMEDEQGNCSEYELDENGQFVWLPDPNARNFAGKWYICDDDGNVISEECNEQDALDMLDKYNDKKKYH